MSAIYNLVLETVKATSKGKPLTMGEVGSGYGKAYGSLAGTLGGAAAGGIGAIPGLIAGTAAGNYLGKSAVKNPNKPINVKNPLHRNGIIANRSMTSKGLAGGLAGAGIGGLVGLGAGLMTVTHKLQQEDIDIDEDDPRFNAAVKTAAKITSLGALGGTVAGSYMAQRKGLKSAAKKMGYGKFGQTMATVPVLNSYVGHTTPEAQRKKKQ